MRENWTSIGIRKSTKLRFDRCVAQMQAVGKGKLSADKTLNRLLNLAGVPVADVAEQEAQCKVREECHQ